MEQQKWYQIDFYIGLYDLDELSDVYPYKESVDKITDIIGDCTVIPCVGSYRHKIGIRINMNSLKVTKFINNNPQLFAKEHAARLKEIFRQESIITNIFECYYLEFNNN